MRTKVVSKDGPLCAPVDESRHQTIASQVPEFVSLSHADVSSRPLAVCPSGYFDPDTLDEPLVGLVFQTDWDATQEYGIVEVRKAVCGESPRRFQMRTNGRWYMSLCSDENAFALSSVQLDDEFVWGAPLRGLPDDYSDRWLRSLLGLRGLYRLEFKKIDELRALAREVGVEKLPRLKSDLIEAIVDRSEGENPLAWPALFDFGQTLVVRADAGMSGVIVSRLRDAIGAGSFAIGSASGPFHSGLLFYDARDETSALRDKREAGFDWHDAQMELLAPVRAGLEARGHRFYFLGKPQEVALAGEAEPRVRFWLNGVRATSPSGRVAQPFGWYSLDELVAEKFVVDLDAKAGA